jgi:hypothetical protein
MVLPCLLMAPEPPLSSAGILAGMQTEITGDLFTAAETIDRTNRQYESQCWSGRGGSPIVFTSTFRLSSCGSVARCRGRLHCQVQHRLGIEVIVGQCLPVEMKRKPYV